MIAPDEIRDKAVKLFEPAVQAWLIGDESFFPKRLTRVDLTFSRDTTQPELIQQVDRLRAGSKQRIGYGYTIIFEEVRKRIHGLNNYPVAIEFETPDDLFRLIGKTADFRRLERCVDTLRAKLPQLETWLREHWKRLLAAESELEDLILVTRYMQQHPRPGCYPRELPLAISTKLVMTNQAILGDWWDRLLPEGAIDFGAVKNFERRYGFRYSRQHLLMRVLDPDLQKAFGLPCDELSLPADELHRIMLRHESLNGSSPICRVVIVENKINLLTMPPLAGSITIGGRGNSMADFLHVPAFERCELEYWGDIDEAGLLMLARARRMFPHVRSQLMDLKTLEAFQHLLTKDSSTNSAEEPPELDELELAALRRCRESGCRLEQEHIPQHIVNAAFGV